MESHVARAVFLSALLRIDQGTGTSAVAREDANLFARDLSRVMNVCTKQDIRICKSFIVKHILPSPARTAAFTKYICVLSKACKPEGTVPDSNQLSDEYEGLKTNQGQRQQPPNTIFRRLHVLYLAHDVLAFATLKLQKDSRHTQALKVDEQALALLQNSIPALARLAVCANEKPSYASKEALDIVEGLLMLWKQHELLPDSLTSGLQDRLKEASTMSFSALLGILADVEAQAALEAQRTKEEASKWMVPKQHHLPKDPDAPWHELPAANGMLLRRTRGELRSDVLPRGGFALKNGGRKADEKMQQDVENILAEAKRCFDTYTDASEVQDIDPLGNVIWKPETNRKRRNHWGWSYDGIEQKRRQKDERNEQMAAYNQGYQ